MKNYKILSKDMRATNDDDMKYEMNVVYKTTGKIIPRKNGFHYYKKIKDLFKYYKNENIRIFECEVDKEITDDEIKYCTNKIKLTRELSKEEIDKYFIDNLDELKKDKDYYVRIAVAQQGYALDELKNDKHCAVRRAVAQQGYALDELKNDRDWSVRRAVVQQGYALDELKNDRDWSVRRAMAQQGYALDELKNDKDWEVRKEALRQIEIKNNKCKKG